MCARKLKRIWKTSKLAVRLLTAAACRKSGISHTSIPNTSIFFWRPWAKVKFASSSSAVRPKRATRASLDSGACRAAAQGRRISLFWHGCRVRFRWSALGVLIRSRSSLIRVQMSLLRRPFCRNCSTGWMLLMPMPACRICRPILASCLN